MKVSKGSSFSGLSDSPETKDEKLLEYSMDFVFAVEDRMEQLGITRSQLADRLGCRKSQVTRILSGNSNITLKTIAAYDAALDIDFELKPKERFDNSATDTTDVSWSVTGEPRNNVIPFPIKLALEG